MRFTLGSTGIVTENMAFGALPIQRISKEEAVRLLQMAHDGGMTYFDTARWYTDSEEKLGMAFSDRRDKLFIATKTGSQDAKGFWNDLEASLRMLKTDYIDVYQFHNPAFVPKPGDSSGLYDCMLKAKAQGKIRHIGITNHRPAVAREAVESGLYETLQFPFSLLAAPEDMELVQRTVEKGMGFVAMKAMSGGLIRSGRAAAAFIAQYPVLPIWGVQRESELREFLDYLKEPRLLTPELKEIIARDQQELGGDFCRGCGYCMPCPQGIEINTCARMSLLLRRAPSAMYLSPHGQEMMKKIETCLNCGKCKSKCPYSLDTPALLRKNYEDYLQVLSGETVI